MERKLTNYLDIDGYPCGNQLWWGKGSFGHRFGCGVIGGLDGLIHRGVVGSSKIGRRAYMTLADELWADIRPHTGFFYNDPRKPCKGEMGIGVFSRGRFRKGLSKFAKRYGYDLTFEQLTNLTCMNPLRSRGGFEEAVTFLERNLMKNQPVHLLSWKDDGNPYQYHWITIVGLKVERTKVEATIMTWGTKVTIEDFESFWRKKGIGARKAMVTYSVARSRG